MPCRAVARSPSSRLMTIADAKDVVSVRIRDTGVGMDADALEKIFEPYFSTKATGTGLGLTIAKRNVELNGGSISVASERGVGTTVTIVLPSGLTVLGVNEGQPSKRTTIIVTSSLCSASPVKVFTSWMSSCRTSSDPGRGDSASARRGDRRQIPRSPRSWLR